MNDFATHACEQVLRFTQVDKWEDLTEDVQAQLIFNVGAMALGLNLAKGDGFLAITKLRTGEMSMEAFRDHVNALIISHKVEVDNEQIARPF